MVAFRAFSVLVVEFMAAIRLLIRLPFLLLHFVIGTPITVMCFYPPFRGRKLRGVTFQDRAIRWWAGTVCRIFGVRVITRGELSGGAQLIVANHISWLDTQVLHSLSPMGFVAKSEIAGWPVAGYLARVGGTVFHKRGSHDSASGVAAAMGSRLLAGGEVAIFPEGGILPGTGIKRFHARLFAAAIETGAPVQPIAIRYVMNGERFDDMTFRARENFAANIFRLLSQPRREAEVMILDPFSPVGLARKEVALEAEKQVRSAFESEIARA